MGPKAVVKQNREGKLENEWGISGNGLSPLHDNAQQYCHHVWVSLFRFTQEIKSKQWLPKSKPGPVKAKVHTTRTKQMILAFFDSKGLVYTNHMPKGTQWTLATLWMPWTCSWRCWRRRGGRQWQSKAGGSWNNAPVHTPAELTNWMTTRQIKWLNTDLFYFPGWRQSWLAAHSPSQRWTSPRRTAGGMRTAKRV